MRVYTVPAAYARMIESTLALASGEITMDIRRRERGARPIVPDGMLDRERTGWITVAMHEVPAPDQRTAESDLADHLHAFTHSLA